jgi:putative copper export protein
MQLDPHVLHLAIRWLHVAAMATAFGGALTVSAFALRRAGAGEASDAALADVALRYEWTFWAAAGVLAMTGIGNLGGFGAALPSSRTDWGATFLLKLVSVLVLVVLSLPRTLAVARLRASAAPLSEHQRSRIRLWYGATTAGFALLAGMAVWLAHG